MLRDLGSWARPARSLAAGTKFVHGIGQFANLTLAGIALLLDELALRDFVHSPFIDDPKGYNPREVGDNQQNPENLELHLFLPFGNSQSQSHLRCTKVKNPALSLHKTCRDKDGATSFRERTNASVATDF